MATMTEPKSEEKFIVEIYRTKLKLVLKYGPEVAKGWSI